MDVEAVLDQCYRRATSEGKRPQQWEREVERMHGARSQWADAVHLFGVIGRGLYWNMIIPRYRPIPEFDLIHQAAVEDNIEIVGAILRKLEVNIRTEAVTVAFGAKRASLLAKTHHNTISDARDFLSTLFSCIRLGSWNLGTLAAMGVTHASGGAPSSAPSNQDSLVGGGGAEGVAGGGSSGDGGGAG
ncbi:hypothetical protein T484DRAFT_1890297, partial [Baffinella frigidus]